MNNSEKPEIWKKKLAELEAEIRKFYNYRLALIGILTELNRRIKLKPNKNYIVYAKELLAEISYLEGWIKAYLKSIEWYKNKLNESTQKYEIRAVAKYTKKPLAYIMLFVVLLLIITRLFLLKPAITGNVVLSKETTYNRTLNLVVNESSNYTWIVDKPGKINSIKASGSVIGNGTVKVYIEKDGEKYLIYSK